MMIEQKLRAAANALPMPKSNFESIESRTEMKQPRRFRPALALVLAIVLMVGCTAATAQRRLARAPDLGDILGIFGYVDVTGLFAPDFEDAQEEAADVGLVIPECFGDSPFSRMNGLNVTTQENWFLSWFDHEYHYTWLTYGNEKEHSTQELDEETGHTYDCTVHWTEDVVHLTFGKTEGDEWRQSFRVDENGVWSIEGLAEGSYETMEYRGKLLQIGEKVKEQTYFDEIRSSHSIYITWIDTEIGAVIELGTTQYEDVREMESTGVSREKLIEYAKELIDINS